MVAKPPSSSYPQQVALLPTVPVDPTVAGTVGVVDAAVVQRLWGLWCDTMGKPRGRVVLSAKRRAKLVARLREPWADPEAMIADAIRGCATSDFHMARGRWAGRPQVYNDLTLICRDAEHVEMFADRWQRRKAWAAHDATGDQVFPWDPWSGKR